MSNFFLKAVVKVHITVGRGTNVQKIDLQPPNWAGESFQHYQDEMMKDVSKNETITMCKGTTSVRAENYPKPIRAMPYSTKGCIIVTNRGTSRSIL